MPENVSVSRLVRWLIFATVLVADVMDLLSTTITNVATPTIVADLSAPSWLAPWLGASYSLALGSTLVLGARLGDRFGGRRIFLIGLAGFAASSAMCALAPAAGVVVVLRVVQGTFGALLIPQGFTLLLRVFPRPDLGRVFGLFGPLMAVSSISGPVLAGVVIAANPWSAGWRAVFLFNAAVAIVAFGVAVRVLPRLDADRTVRLDPIAAVLLSAGLLGVLGALTLLGTLGPAWPEIAAGLGGVLALGMFTGRQRTAANPLLAGSLFHHRAFVAGVLVGMGFFAVTAGLLLATTLYLQLGRGLSVLPAAAIVATTSAGIIVASFSTRALISTLGKRLLLLGLLILATGTGIYVVTLLLAPGLTAILTVPLFVCGLGMGCGFGTVFAVALGNVTEAEAGSASGTLNAAQQIANAAGAVLVSTAYLALTRYCTPAHALAACLAIVLVCATLSLLALPLLPSRAAKTH